jgi:hypothetical protein
METPKSLVRAQTFLTCPSQQKKQAPLFKARIETHRMKMFLRCQIFGQEKEYHPSDGQALKDSRKSKPALNSTTTFTTQGGSQVKK